MTGFVMATAERWQIQNYEIDNYFIGICIG